MRARRRDAASAVVRRLPAIVCIAGVAIAAVAAGDPAPRVLPEAASNENAVALPAAGTRSSAWYCPGAPPSAGEPTATRIWISNTGTRDSAAAVTVVAGGSRTGSRIELPARSVVRFDPREVSDDPSPAVVVEPFVADVVVEEAVSTRTDVAFGPCATQPAAAWYFANGTTVRGVEQWLLLFNPFGDDAIVDLSLYTDEGRKEVEALRGIDVPRHSRVAVDLHNHVRRQAFVAVEATSRIGRVVATQSEVFLADSGRSGITSSLGSPATSSEWRFPFGARRGATTMTVGIGNPGDLEAEVEVQVFAEGDVLIEPITVKVPRRSGVLVNLAECPEGASSCINLPSKLHHQVMVRSTTDVPVVVEELGVYTGRESANGAVSLLGVRSASDRWVFGRSRYGSKGKTSLVVASVGEEPVDVRVRLVGGGDERELDPVTIDAGRRTVIDLTGLQPDSESEAAVVVEATGPVVAEQVVALPNGVSVHAGIPERE